MPATSVLGALAHDTTLATALGPTGKYEVDQVSVGAATAGTVTLAFTWNAIAYTTAAIQWNAALAAVIAAIQAATGPQGQTLPANAVTGSGTLATGVQVNFGGAMIGPVTGQTITPSGLTGGTATFTRTVQGVSPIVPTELRVLGTGGVLYRVSGVGAGDGTTSLGVYMNGTPAQGNLGSGAPTAALGIGIKDVTGKLSAPSLDAAGALRTQAQGADGSPAPALTEQVGGVDASGNLQALSVDASGSVSLQSSGTPGVTAPSKAVQVGGVDPSGSMRAASVNVAGALAIQDASSVPEAPISINGTAFTVGQAGAPAGPLAVTTGSTTPIADSTGGGAINGLAGQRDIGNPGNVDIYVTPALTAVWGAGWLLRPGGSVVTTYSGPISVITQNTNGGVAVGSPSALVSVMEWA